MKKYLNKYTYLLFGLITLIIISIFIIIPNFETEEFSQEVIEDIIDGVTTTSIQSNNEESQTQEVNENNEDSLEISKEETSEITKKFTAFTADKDVAGFEIGRAHV